MGEEELEEEEKAKRRGKRFFVESVRARVLRASPTTGGANQMPRPTSAANDVDR